MKEIKSLQNPRIKELLKLKKPRERRERGQFLIEGYKEIKAAASYGVNIFEFYYCPELAKENPTELITDENIVEIPQKIFDRLSYRENGDGFLAVAETFSYTLEDIDPQKETIIPVFENVEKPGNLGAVIRTVVSMGLNTLVLNDMQTDIFNPNVIRASLGGMFGVKIVKATPKETYNWLKDNGYEVLVTSAHASEEYTSVDLKQSFGLILGSESSGVSDYWRENADKLVTIPMEGEVSSLNVSTATAVILYEARRQRNSF